ncbi:C40 family peptidase [Pseudodesulfovibrio sp.]|nr:C40 family peptidase [Pseudodesulfovibrio sp.]
MLMRATFPRYSQGLLIALVLATLLMAGGCASKTPQPPPGAQPAKVKQQPASGKAAAIIRTARAMIGVRYQWGGESPSQGFDCSGLTWFAFHQHGINLPRISWQQFGVGKTVSYSDMRPGDLIFHKVDKSGKSLHVGILTDRGTFIHAPSSGKRVMESSLNNPYWREHFIGARRVL